MINKTCPDYISQTSPHSLFGQLIHTTEVDLMNVSHPPSELNYTATLSPPLLLSRGTIYEFKLFLTNDDTKVPSYYYSGKSK